MSGIVPRSPVFPSPGNRDASVCEVIQSSVSPRRADIFRLCTALPRGMPDKLEVCVIRHDYGVERSIAAYYSGRAYLIHIAMTPAGT